jgi:N-acetylglucosaminyldiphosphoundecaprenol N-acetyl-beta-D-mannosaminyltransferase
MKNIMKKTINNGLKVGQIMGINVNSTTTSSVLARVEGLMADSVQFSIVTPNPELILMAQTNKDLKNTLNSAAFSIPDGIGVVMASKFYNLPVPKNKLLKFIVILLQGLKVGLSVFLNKKWLMSDVQNIKGRELFLELIKLAGKNNWKVFLLGGIDNEATIAASNLKKQFSNLKIEASSGPRLGIDGVPATNIDNKLEKDSIDQINSFKPQLLFVAFGNPKQEIWIHKNLSRLNVGGAMAVGGTFRYVAGMSKLPPEWMASVGLEWLWRLVTEPMRMGRIFRAVVVFPLKVFFYKLLAK